MISNEIVPLQGNDSLLPDMLIWEESADGHFTEYTIKNVAERDCQLQGRNGQLVSMNVNSLLSGKFYRSTAEKKLF